MCIKKLQTATIFHYNGSQSAEMSLKIGGDESNIRLDVKKNNLKC